MMYIGKDLIATVNLDTERISKPGYLGQFKRTLKLKYRELIQQNNDKLDFLVVTTANNNQSQEDSLRTYLNNN